MTARNSTKARRQCFDAARYVHPLTGRTVIDCYQCGDVIDPVRQEWHADHVIARALSDNDDVSNLAPICLPCHKTKTRIDVKVIAKVKRISDRHFGVRRSSRPMPGSRNSPWKKTFSNGWVRRDA